MTPSTYNAPPANVAPRKGRSLVKTILLSVAGLFGAFVALCVVLAIVDPPDPAEEAAKAAQSKAAASATASRIGQYAGQWRGQDGTSLFLRGNGSADFDMGSTKVTGGKATFDTAGETLTISGIFGIKQSWVITKPPHETAAGNTEMTLGGVVYRRSEGFTPQTGESESANNSTNNGINTSDNFGGTDVKEVPALPSRAETTRLVDGTMESLGRALRMKSFGSFHALSAERLRRQVTPDGMRRAFADFDAETVERALRGVGPQFPAKPTIRREDGTLGVLAHYSNGPLRVQVKARYARENGAWKLLFIDVKRKEVR